MKALAVRVSKGQVLVGGKVVSSIARGIALFAAIEKGDTASSLEEIAQ